MAVPALIEALSDEDSGVRASAASALGKIGEPAKEAITALIQALSDKDESVRRAAAEVLKKIGTPEAMKAVEAYEKRK
jgi:HEAT repeat protein